MFFEKLIFKRLKGFSHIISLFNENQFGLGSNCSTIGSIVSVIQKIRFHSNNLSILTQCTFIEIKNSFDRVNHDIFLDKFESSGFEGLTLNFLKSYFENRKHYVISSRKKSKVQGINSCPTGKIIGPVSIFLIYK